MEWRQHVNKHRTPEEIARMEENIRFANEIHNQNRNEWETRKFYSDISEQIIRLVRVNQKDVEIIFSFADHFGMATDIIFSAKIGKLDSYGPVWYINGTYVYNMDLTHIVWHNEETSLRKAKSYASENLKCELDYNCKHGFKYCWTETASYDEVKEYWTEEIRTSEFQYVYDVFAYFGAKALFTPHSFK